MHFITRKKFLRLLLDPDEAEPDERTDPLDHWSTRDDGDPENPK
jgi:hypothetical protein